MADERSSLGNKAKRSSELRDKAMDNSIEKSAASSRFVAPSADSSAGEDAGTPEERAVSGVAQIGDKQVDHALRPRSLDEMIGQDRLRGKIEILVEAARKRGDALDHVLVYGPPGLGKTTLSHILANEMGANLKVTAGPAIEKAGDLAAILTNLRKAFY
jgi:DNA helicase TIP49 (TBP-interacting protein)